MMMGEGRGSRTLEKIINEMIRAHESYKLRNLIRLGKVKDDVQKKSNHHHWFIMINYQSDQRVTIQHTQAVHYQVAETNWISCIWQADTMKDNYCLARRWM